MHAACLPSNYFKIMNTRNIYQYRLLENQILILEMGLLTLAWYVYSIQICNVKLDLYTKGSSIQNYYRMNEIN